MSGEESPLLEALKVVASTFKDARVRFALAGGCAVYARGGERSTNDVDFVVTPGDVPAATEAIRARGLEVLQPPEDWLFKARHDGAKVDVIFRLPTGPVDGELLGRADVLSVESIAMPVLGATDLLLAKLLALSAHHCDLEPVLAAARSLREQLDPEVIVKECAGRPYAEAALFLIDRLGILPVAPPPGGPVDLSDPREEIR
jgi:Uncharacterised nucleotidyltransferase